MLTKSQRTFISSSFAAVTAGLDALPHNQQLPARLLAKCPGTVPEARALWWLAFYLGKPSRIPTHFGTLLSLTDDQAFAAALVSEHADKLHAVLSQKAIHRMNCIDLAYTVEYAPVSAVENTVGAGDNYWQVIDERPEVSGTEQDLSDYYDTRQEADVAYDELPGAGRLMSTHDDGRSDQFDW